MWVAGASGERQAEKAGQQAYAAIDPRQDKEDDYDYGWPRGPSFISLMVQGGATAQSNASSPDSGAPIGPRPPHGPAAMARSGLFGASGETSPSCGIVLLRIPRHEPPHTELPGRALGEAKGCAGQCTLFVACNPARCNWC